MKNISLNLINRSQSVEDANVIIFQQNAAASTETSVAWKVISNLGPGDYHPFGLSIDLTVAAADPYGNITPQLPAPDGTRFDMISSPMGNRLNLNERPASSPQVVEIYNELPVGSVSALAYRNGLLLAQTTGIAQGQKAVFVFEPIIYLTLNSEIEEGQIMEGVSLNTTTQISLLGIKGADIVLTGGGSGAGTQPFMFSLQNLVMA